MRLCSSWLEVCTSLAVWFALGVALHSLPGPYIVGMGLISSLLCAGGLFSASFSQACITSQTRTLLCNLAGSSQLGRGPAVVCLTFSMLCADELVPLHVLRALPRQQPALCMWPVTAQSAQGTAASMAQVLPVALQAGWVCPIWWAGEEAGGKGRRQAFNTPHGLY